ncbi:hypothetical protein FHR81_002977 [Actinoalloteichus hoggarensis]|uniref:Pyrrolo-quinoline quinone repeat domain-containing protein n=1 Tax=Actinoalloteichus hoggarensis TaxID=1470176 RepID=A0A221VYG6_9PSEU|nr:PQQ-binding-like beta-propeller repeat protein [Actinoalloteichus hoggarensis]ASO18569.1 hypothetical protein AHOG_04565 [Actinoalloteichus hoggarensis]MBB5921937.1 hypothetical protein [Actinoalloteichus hoggarensis]
MVRPERRTKVDVLVVVLIVVVALGVGAVSWYTGDLRATTLRTAGESAEVPAPPTRLPPSLAEVWSAPSPATDRPSVAGPSVVVGADGTVRGLDPFSGEGRWSYERDLPLCTVGAQWDRAVAVYAKSRNCSEVTSLDGDTGERGPQRNTDAEQDTTLLGDGTYLTATGRRLTEVWGSNLVRTLQYGRVPALVNPDRQPRVDCEHRAFAAGDARLAVIERCAEDPAERLTVLKARPEDDDRPEEDFSVPLDEPDTTVIATSDAFTVIAAPSPPTLIVYDSHGIRVEHSPLPFTEDEFDTAARPVPLTTITEEHVFWYAAGTTTALSADDGRLLWTTADTLGSGTLFAGTLLVPVPGALAVLDPSTGERLGELPVDRGDHDGPITMDSIGPVLLEQRGDTLVALR